MAQFQQKQLSSRGGVQVNSHDMTQFKSAAGPVLKDNRPSSAKLGRIFQLMQGQGNSAQRSAPNSAGDKHGGGLPSQLKQNIEAMSGHTMDDVRVHYNSDKPAQLNAHAFAQGNDIHLASGQEKHLPHEAWHVVQQKQGRVKPTAQLKNVGAVNTDKSLEREADVMGSKAVQMQAKPFQRPQYKASMHSRGSDNTTQLKVNVIQFIARDDIIDEGFSGAQADLLRDVMGGWVAARNLVNDNGVSAAYFQTVVNTYDNNALRRRILLQLNEHNFQVARIFWGADAELQSLINKGLNNDLVNEAAGYPVPAARAIIYSLHDIDAINDVRRLGRIFYQFPNFVAHVDAEKGANPDQVQEVINYLGARNNAGLGFLRQKNPTFAQLRALQQNNLSTQMLQLLPDFSTENPPGNNAYEAIGAKGKSYRVGHFARYHTLKGIPLNQDMQGGKTIYPHNIGIADIRAGCLEFDNATAFNAGFPNAYNYVAPALTVNSRIRNNNAENYFDQMYPTVGDDITNADVTALSAVKAVRADWS